MFIKYEAEVSSRVGGGERGVVDFGKLFTETNEQKFSLKQAKWKTDRCSRALLTVTVSSLLVSNGSVDYWASTAPTVIHSLHGDMQQGCSC